jgi:hypothetical protein
LVLFYKKRKFSGIYVTLLSVFALSFKALNVHFLLLDDTNSLILACVLCSTNFLLWVIVSADVTSDIYEESKKERVK